MWSIFDRIQDIDGLSSSFSRGYKKKKSWFPKRNHRALNAKNDNFQQKTKLANLMFTFKREVDIEVRIVIEV